jgi:hypothetical protein
MDPVALIYGSIGAVVFFGALAGIAIGVRRLQGRRSRFDRVFEGLIRAGGAGVYPPSLRGNPDPQVQEDVEVGRGDRAMRRTPGNELHSEGGIRTGR